MEAITKEYKILRQSGGKSAFAVVRVTAREGVAEGAGIACAEGVANMYEDWRQSVLQGCKEALHALRDDEAREAIALTIVEVRATVVDTTPDALHAAAAMATAQALGEDQRATLERTHDLWHVVWT